MWPESKAGALFPLFFYCCFVSKAVAANAAVHAEVGAPASAYALDLLLSCDASSIKGEGSNVHKLGNAEMQNLPTDAGVWQHQSLTGSVCSWQVHAGEQGWQC